MTNSTSGSWQGSACYLLLGAAFGYLQCWYLHAADVPPSKPKDDKKTTKARLQRSSIPCAFIGLGAMGKHMATHLIKVSDRVLVHNRTHSKASAHSKEHGTVACADLAAMCEARVIMLCLPTTADVDKTVTALIDAGLTPGCVIVDSTSGEPTASVEIARRLAECGCFYVDAPVSGGPRGAEGGTLTVMAGGEEKERCALTLLPPLPLPFTLLLAPC